MPTLPIDHPDLKHVILWLRVDREESMNWDLWAANTTGILWGTRRYAKTNQPTPQTVRVMGGP